MASSYKWPLLTFFVLATMVSAWIGRDLALRNSATQGPVAVDPNRNVQQSGRTVSTNVDKDSAKNSNKNAGQSSSRQLIDFENRAIAVEKCEISMAQVNDPKPPLSIREMPSPQSSVVGEVNNGQFIDVNGSQGQWFSVTAPVKGWAPRDLTTYACNQKEARVEFPRGAKAIDLEGTFIGAGSHRYKLRASRNQNMTLESEVGPMPRLVSPSNQTLFAGPDEGDPATWTGVLPEEGDYFLELDSKFRGYPYRFNVRID